MPEGDHRVAGDVGAEGDVAPGVDGGVLGEVEDLPSGRGGARSGDGADVTCGVRLEDPLAQVARGRRGRDGCGRCRRRRPARRR